MAIFTLYKRGALTFDRTLRVNGSYWVELGITARVTHQRGLRSHPAEDRQLLAYYVD